MAENSESEDLEPLTMNTDDERTIKALLDKNTAEIKLDLTKAINELKESLPCAEIERRVSANERSIGNGKEKDAKAEDNRKQKQSYRLSKWRLVVAFAGLLATLGFWDLMKYLVTKF